MIYRLKVNAQYVFVVFSNITVRSMIVSTSFSLTFTSTVSALVSIWKLVMMTAGSMVTLKASCKMSSGAKNVSPAARAVKVSALLINATGLSGEPGREAIGKLTSVKFSPHTKQDRKSL